MRLVGQKKEKTPRKRGKKEHEQSLSEEKVIPTEDVAPVEEGVFHFSSEDEVPTVEAEAHEEQSPDVVGTHAVEETSAKEEEGLKEGTYSAEALEEETPSANSAEEEGVMEGVQIAEAVEEPSEESEAVADGNSASTFSPSQEELEEPEGGAVQDMEFTYPKEEALLASGELSVESEQEESPADVPYVPEWKEPEEEDDSGPQEPEGFEDEKPDVKPSKKEPRRKRKKAVIVEDEEVPEEVYVEPEPPAAKKARKKVSVKDLLISLLETTIAAAVFCLIGYQVGGVVLGRLLENILGG